MRLIAKIRGVNVKKSTSKIQLFRTLKKRRQNNIKRISV